MAARVGQVLWLVAMRDKHLLCAGRAMSVGMVHAKLGDCDARVSQRGELFLFRAGC
ncbi:MAG: hypothetical protein R3E01_13010 [Pirellulaceae bacterium]